MDRLHPQSEVLEIIKNQPDAILWCAAHEFGIEKLANGCLGIVVDTFPFTLRNETCTIVTVVKPECCAYHIDNKHLLDVGFRILEVEGHDITRLKLRQVVDILKSCKSRNNVVKLVLTRPHSYKRANINDSKGLHNRLLATDNLNQPTINKNSSAVSKTVDYNQNGRRNNFSLEANGIKLERLEEKSPGSSTRTNKKILDRLVVDGHKEYFEVTTFATGGGIGRIVSELTPVESPDLHFELIDENTPLMDSFSDVVNAPNGTENDNDVVKEALQNPANIIWESNPQKIILKKRSKKIGFHYKVKKTKDEKDIYFLVDKVSPDTPAHGRLHPGDWIRSVNGNPITDNQTLLENEIKRTDEVSLVIQRPQQILRKENRRSQDSAKLNVNTGLGTNTKNNNSLQTPDLETTSNLHSPRSLQSFTSPGILDNLEIDDIKIDGMSVYNGPVSMEITQSEVFEVNPSFMSNYSNIQTIGGTAIKDIVKPKISAKHSDPTLNSIKSEELLGHKRNTSDPLANSLVKDVKTNGDTNSFDLTIQGPKLFEIPLSDVNYDINKTLTSCVNYVAKAELDKIPYVRLNVLSTTNSSHCTFTKKLASALGFKSHTDLNSKHLFEVHDEALTCIDGSKNHSIEETILAKDIADRLRSDTARGECIEKRLKGLKSTLASSKEDVYGIKLQKIASSLDLPSDVYFLELEIQNFTYKDIQNLWPSVYFTSNSISIIMFDSEEMITNRSSEIRKIFTCINLIRSSNSKTKIYLVGNVPKSVKFPEAVEALEGIENNLSNMCNTSGESYICSDCQCDKSRIVCSPLEQIRKNDATERIWFFEDKKRDWESFVDDLHDLTRRRDFVDMRYPKAALLAYQILKQEKSNVVLQSCLISWHNFKSQVMSKFMDASTCTQQFCDIVLKALHHSGKVIDHSQVPHRTTTHPVLDMFLCQTPSIIRDSLNAIQQRRPLSDITTSKNATATTTTIEYCYKLHDLQKHLGDHHKELLAFLELFHILEPRDRDRTDFYFTPTLIWSFNYDTTNKQKNALSFKKDGRNKKLYVDFHKFLPLNMCLSTLSGLEESLDEDDGQSDIIDAFTGFYNHKGIKFLVNMIPISGIAEITIEFQEKHTGEEFYKFIRSAFSKAIPTNLLTYHIGTSCTNAINSKRSALKESSIEQHNILHVIDIEQPASLGLHQDHSFWNSSQVKPVPAAHLGPNTRIKQMPPDLIRIICNGLNGKDKIDELADLLIQDETTSQQLRLLKMEKDPCLEILLRYMDRDKGGGEQIYTVKYLLGLVCDDHYLGMKNIQRHIVDWMKIKGIYNWMENGVTYS